MFTKFYTVYRAGINLLFIEEFRESGCDHAELFIDTTNQLTATFLLELGAHSSHPIHVEIHHGQTYLESAKSQMLKTNGTLFLVKNRDSLDSETEELIKFAKKENRETFIIDLACISGLNAADAGKFIHNQFLESSLQTSNERLGVLGEQGFTEKQELHLTSCLGFMF